MVGHDAPHVPEQWQIEIGRALERREVAQLIERLENRIRDLEAEVRRLEQLSYG